jgi:hypothetical protein
MKHGVEQLYLSREYHFISNGGDGAFLLFLIFKFNV